ncbi:unnamed protein product, partial [Ixodes hexagonus]
MNQLAAVTIFLVLICVSITLASRSTVRHLTWDKCGKLVKASRICRNMGHVDDEALRAHFHHSMRTHISQSLAACLSRRFTMPQWYELCKTGEGLEKLYYCSLLESKQDHM